MNLNLREQLPALYALQAIDQEIHRLSEERRVLVRALRRLQADRKQRQEALEAKQAAYTELQVKHRNKNTEFLTNQERLARYQEQQKNARDANEYTALTKQIETSTQLLGEMEEEIIEMLLLIDEAKEALDEETARFEAFEKEYAVERQRIVEAGKQLDAELAERREARAAQAAHVDPNLLKRYELWVERRGGTMVSKVQVTVTQERSGKEVYKVATYSCGECHMSIPTQLMLEAISFERLYECPSCHRLLYPPEEDYLADEADEDSSA